MKHLPASLIVLGLLLSASVGGWCGYLVHDLLHDMRATLTAGVAGAWLVDEWFQRVCKESLQ